MFRGKLSSIAMILLILIGCNNNQEDNKMKELSSEDILNIQNKQYSERVKNMELSYGKNIVEITSCKNLYDDNIKSYFKATIKNKTNRTIKGIHAHSADDGSDNFLSFKIQIKPHSSSVIETSFPLCAYYLTGAIYSNGEYQDLMVFTGDRKINGIDINNPILHEQPTAAEE